MECEARNGLPRFVFPSNSNGMFSSTMLSGGDAFACKEVECFAVNFD